MDAVSKGLMELSSSTEGLQEGGHCLGNFRVSPNMLGRSGVDGKYPCPNMESSSLK